MVVKHRVFKLPNGRIISKRKHQRLQRQQQLAKGRVIPHAENPGYEKYDMTYRKSHLNPASQKLPWDFSQ